MPKFANVSGRNAVKAFKRAGFVHVHTQGNHAVLQKPGIPTLSIPLHKQVARFLLKSQIKRAKITEREFEELLKGKRIS